MTTKINNYSGSKQSKYFMTLSIGEYKRPAPFEVAAFQSETTIVLPLPMELRDDTTISYNNQDLQLSGDILNGSGGQGILSEGLRRSGDMLSGIISKGADAAVSAFGKGDGFAKTIGTKVGEVISQALPPEQVTSAIQQTLGLAPNPNASVAFDRVDLRQHSFSWTFLPVNKVDSQTIHNIIKILKRAALPSTTGGGSSAILNYPKMVQPNFFPWDDNGGGSHGWSDKSIIKIKKCFISAVNVSYSTGSVPAFFQETNSPVTIQVSVALKEIEYFLANDYSDDNSSFKSLLNLDTLLKTVTTAFKAEETTT